MAYRHSGYPGGLRSTSYAKLLDNKPEELIRRAVRGMLPKNTLGRQMLIKLKVYAGPDHPHAAQGPEPLELPWPVAPADANATARKEPAMPNRYVQSTGRRKAAVARVRFRPGQGDITVNQRPIEEYFTSATHRCTPPRPCGSPT